MLPSALPTASASAIIGLSRLNNPPRNDCCVRFATVVTFRPATLATNRTLLLHWTGLSPAGSRQLCVAHWHNQYFQRHEMYFLERKPNEIADPVILALPLAGQKPRKSMI
jgi:hypothetical protein